MWGKERLLDIMDNITRIARHEGVACEAIYTGAAENTMRSACGQAHQVSSIDSGEITVRLREGKRFIEFTLPQYTANAIRQRIRTNLRLLAQQRPNEHLGNMVRPPARAIEVIRGLQQNPPNDFHDPARKADIFEALHLRTASATKWEVSARIYTVSTETVVANTAELLRYYTARYCGFAVTANTRKRRRTLTAYAQRCAQTLGQLPTEEVFSEVVDRISLIDRLPFVEIFNGGKQSMRRDTILSPYAVQALLDGVTSFTFAGDCVDDRVSYLTGLRQGRRVADKSFTLTDDWQHPDVVPLPFDYEGRSRKRVCLIEKGQYRNLVWDAMSANKSKRKNAKPTGHSFWEPGSGVPACQVIQAGEKTYAELVESSMRPTLAVTFLHYPALSYPREGVLTASAVHGTFLIKDGRYQAVVANPLRVRIATFDALQNVDGITKAIPIYDWENYGIAFPFSYVVPAMRIKSSVLFLNGNA